MITINKKYYILLILSLFTLGAIANTQPQPKKTYSVSFAATMKSDEKPLSKGVQWWVKSYPEDKILRYSNDSQPALLFYPGSYIIVARIGQTREAKLIHVGPKQPSQYLFNLNAGVIQLRATTQHMKYIAHKGPTWHLHKKQPDGQWHSVAKNYSYNPSFILPAGHYRLTTQFGHHQSQRNIEIIAGKHQKVLIPMITGEAELVGTVHPKYPPIKNNLHWWVYPDPYAKKPITSSSNSQAKFHLPPGQYYVKARHGTVTKSGLLEIKAQHLTSKNIHFNTATLHLTAHHGINGHLIKQVNWRIIPANSSIHFQPGQLNHHGVTATFILPAGEYQVQAKYREYEQQVPISVSTGEDKPLTVYFSRNGKKRMAHQ